MSRLVKRSTLVLMAMILVVSACGDDEGTTTTAAATTEAPATTGGATTEAPATTAATTTATTEPPASFKADVVVAIDKWDPNLVPREEQFFEHTSPLYDPMFKIVVTEQDFQVLEPAFVREWGLSDDGTRFSMTLQEGVVAEGYGEITAEDVVFMLNDHYRTYEGSFLDGLWSPLGVTAEAVGTYQVDVFRSDGSPLPPRVVFNDIPRRVDHVVSKAHLDAVGFDEATNNPVGTGAFTLVSASSGEEVYQARDEHWRVVPSMETLTIQHVPESQIRAQLVTAGRADLARRVETVHALAADGQGGASLVPQPFDKTYYVNFGGLERDQATWGECPWVDQRVREAMAISVDRETMFSALRGGVGSFRNAVNPRPAETALDPYDYDPDRAKTLLADAGYPNGFAFDMPLMLVGGAARVPEEHDALLSYFSAIGLQPTSEQIDIGANWGTWTARELPCWTFVWSTPALPWAPSQNWDKFTTGFETSGAYVDPESSRLAQEILAAAEAGDLARFEQLEAEGYAYLHEQVALIPLYTSVSWNVVGEGFVEWDWQGHDDATRYDGLAFAG